MRSSDRHQPWSDFGALMGGRDRDRDRLPVARQWKSSSQGELNRERTGGLRVRVVTSIEVVRDQSRRRPRVPPDSTRAAVLRQHPAFARSPCGPA